MPFLGFYYLARALLRNPGALGVWFCGMYAVGDQRMVSFCTRLLRQSPPVLATSRLFVQSFAGGLCKVQMT
jgi:hypothetical protein